MSGHGMPQGHSSTPMNRRQLLTNCGITFGSIVSWRLSDLQSSTDRKIIVDETIPAGDTRQVESFNASADQSLTTEVTWPTEEYAQAVGLVIGYEQESPPDRSVINQILDTDEVGPHDDQTVIYHWVTSGRRFQTLLEESGEYGATVTMDIRQTDRLPSSRPVDMHLRIALSDHPEDSPF